MERIASFTVDHNKLLPGLYLSRRDGDIVTLNLRFKRPHSGDLLSNSEIHSAEHRIAALLRNSPQKEAVIYFLFDSRPLSLKGAVDLLKTVFAQAAAYRGEMPGRSAAECGNYVNLDLDTGRAVCRFYAELIRDRTVEQLAYD